MTGEEQRAELHRRIWQIANEVRGAILEKLLDGVGGATAEDSSVVQIAWWR